MINVSKTKDGRLVGCKVMLKESRHNQGIYVHRIITEIRWKLD